MGVILTPAQSPSAVLRRRAVPVPPRSSVRRVLRPRPRPRIRRVIGACRRSPAQAAPSGPDLRVREACPITDATEVRVVLAAQELHVVGRHEPAIRRLVLELVHRHVLVLLLALQGLVAARTDDALELQNLGNVLVAFTTNSTVAMAPPRAFAAFCH